MRILNTGYTFQLVTRLRYALIKRRTGNVSTKRTDNIRILW